MSDMTTIPHAKAAKPGPWCNTAPTLRQRAKRRRHSLGGADELLAPRSLTDERTRPAEVVSKDATPTAARGEDAGVPTSDLTGSSPPEPSTIKYYRPCVEKPDGTEVYYNYDGTVHSIVTPDPLELAIRRWKTEPFLPPPAVEPPRSTPLGRAWIKTMTDALNDAIERRARAREEEARGGGGICEHGRMRSACKECGGSQICEHGRQRSQCRQCGGSVLP